jgi:elongation factor G
LIPLKRGTGNRFESELAADALPPLFVAAVEKGVMESLESGTLMGYPVVDVQAVLIDALWREGQGTELAYKVSASMAVKDALSKASPFLLDPIMDVEVQVPENYTGDVIGDIHARGGKIESIEQRHGLQAIRAIVPLAKMFGYSTSLRSATQGRGTYTMKFSHFDKL